MPDTTPLGARPDRATYFRGFQELSRWRVQNILLVASLYDSFILAEDDQLNEVLLSDFLGFGQRSLPAVRQVSTGAEALALARDTSRYNLVIASPRVGDMDAPQLARALRREGIETPIAVLAYDERDLAPYSDPLATPDIDWLFLWQGDVHVLLAIAKCVEDWMNAPFDTGVMGVQAILVVEDRIRFYSSFLPIVYREVIAQAQRLVPEGINLAHKLMRIQARPKILLSRTFEEAWQAFTAYQDNVLGVISDIEFPWQGTLRADAGVELARKIRAQQPDVPIVLQSALPQTEALASAIGASFLLKGSPTLLSDLRAVMLDTFGFGDFVFRTPDGAEVGRAHDLKGLEEQLLSVPVESLGFHGERNHFSNWLKARTEFGLAHRLRPRKVSDFRSLEHLRLDLIEAIQAYRHQVNRGGIVDFQAGAFDPEGGFYRVGGGSLGGKARGLAFVNHLLSESGIRDRFPGVRIGVPTTLVVGTQYFDEFLASNDLSDFALRASDDAELMQRFLEARLPGSLEEALGELVHLARYPLAVRSSSLLEDSQYQPFAGIYDTYMLPNGHPDAAVRLVRLVEAIKRVYASTFTSRAKAYLRATAYRLEEEKMAVILQRLVGTPHGERFYPDMAGVARSHNFYPTPPLRPEDGVAAVALGLGSTVVEGETCLRFSPRYPRHLLQFSSVKDLLKNTQRDFHALRLDRDVADSPRATLETYSLDVAERDGTLAFVGSTYSKENDAIYDGISRPGPRVVSFAPVLKHGLFPLADVLALLLEEGGRGTSAPIEIEFAVRLARERGEPAEFAFLQLRPLAAVQEVAAVDVDGVEPERVLCRSAVVLGHGRLDELCDVVVVDQHRFDRAQSLAVARDVALFNAELARSRRRYLLIGVGRWGSSDPFLGIPVRWDQISGAQVIVEAGFRDFKVAPSQGSHFFQNLTASGVGYFTVNPQSGEGLVDWDWLAAQAQVGERGCVRLLHFDRPLSVTMDGRHGRGVILKPARGE